ncbi:MAG: ATP-dependent DNA helicase DinG [Legionella sp.]|nr:MAG: ATP-dependent DNA helicase DinG [Legionella sp.]
MARTQQATLAASIADAILHQRQLVVEAGTGTGKTFAYLVPSLLSGKKVIISTATKTLQDQLVQKDLPLLIQALGLSTRVQNLKGRSNYICHHRTELFSEQNRQQSAACAQDIAYVREKLPQLTHGERSELPELNEESTAWPFVTSTLDNCLGRACDFHSKCFLMQARKRAIEADVVVINHHVFFADARLKEEGFGELLPQVGTVVFDEAHQLADIATEFHTSQFGTRQVRDLFDDMVREWPVLDLPNQPFKQWSVVLDQILDRIWLAASEDRSAWDMRMKQPSFRQAWSDLLAFVEDWMALLPAPNAEDGSGFAQFKQKGIALHAFIHQFCLPDKQTIRWVEKFKRSVVFHQTPLDISDGFHALLSRNACAYVFTSATLTVSDSFACFIKPLGLKQPVTLQLPSPFDFTQQALLYLPRSLPDPKNLLYYEALLAKALPVIKACGGRCFFLFTSHRALQQVAVLLRSQLPFPLLVQGEEAKPILLERFRQLGNAVLLGTATFWEGVDVKGDSLSCVIIDKIPFASPKDPVFQGKMHYLKTQGLSGFHDISLAAAVLALKQGVGRLIRDMTDRGVLMIADPRLTGRAYGEHIFASLPPIGKTRDEKTVLAFIERGFRT